MKHLSIPYRILALMMSILLLFNGLGMSMDVHYCQTQLKSFSLLGKAKNCQQMASNSHCKQKQEESTKTSCKNEEKGCCTSKTFLFTAESSDGIIPKSIVNQEFPTLFVELFEEKQLDNFSVYPFLYKHYKPPLLSRDIPILVQTFLL